jgi:nicotinate phosphoribosyltransferase
MPYIGRDQDYEEPLAQPSAMWADLYALTMWQALFLDNRRDLQQATFHGFIRKTPYNAAYLVTGGQNIIAEWYDKNWRFTERDLRCLAAKEVIHPKTGNLVKVFVPEFLDMLSTVKPALSIDMMPEGELGFATEPLVKTFGPIGQGLAVEGAILNTINSQSNFATYASILKTAANGKMVAEFGLRRSQAVGGLSSTRGSYIGGIDATSNCWAETNYGIPTIGTIAHAYVMIHPTEFDAYMNWATHCPHLPIILPDTYNAEEGMKKAVAAYKKAGAVLLGFRQDSGDLGWLAAEGRKIALKENWTLTKNAASNDLDAKIIADLEQRYPEALDLYAVGTKLATCAEQPALGGVYKVANVYKEGLTHQEIMAMKQAVREGLVDPSKIRDRVRDIMKLSSQLIKMTYPGELDLIRYLTERDGKLYFDGGTIYPEWAPDPLAFDDPADPFSGRLTRSVMSVRRDNHILSKTFNKGARAYRPLQPAFREGKLVGNIETVHIGRERAKQRMEMLDPAHKRLLNPHEHVVGVEEGLLQRQGAMARRLRSTGDTVEANLV